MSLTKLAEKTARPPLLSPDTPTPPCNRLLPMSGRILLDTRHTRSHLKGDRRRRIHLNPLTQIPVIKYTLSDRWNFKDPTNVGLFILGKGSITLPKVFLQLTNRRRANGLP
jgi:hypothetical protein